MVEWDKIGSFERFPKLAEKLSTVGSSMSVIFTDDGKDIEASVLKAAMKDKGLTNIKAKDTVVFVVKEYGTGADYEFWISATSFTNLRELKVLREGNGNTLKGARGIIKRISKDDPDKASFQITRV